jgi:segregation and condensation protein A
MPASAEQSADSPPTSEVPAGAQYSVQLPSFEGPLDLLLHLCQKHELNILDIPIGFVTEKYLEYLAVMQIMSLDIASEYLVMAATLAHIKSKLLLPAPPPGQEDELSEEEEDPRESLIRRLLEYQKYKLAGEQLQSRGVAGRDVFLRGTPIEEAVHTGLPPLKQVPLFSLVEAFQSVLSKSKIKISHDIVHERITLTDRINELVDILRVKKRIQFEEMFNDLTTRFDLVITFLAILEMTKLRMTRLHQSEPMAPIYVEFSAQIEETSETSEGTEGEEKKPEAPVEEEPKLGTNVSDTEPPPDMTHMTEPPPAEPEEEDVHQSHETIPSPPLSEDEDPK